MEVGVWCLVCGEIELEEDGGEVLGMGYCWLVSAVGFAGSR